MISKTPRLEADIWLRVLPFDSSQKPEKNKKHVKPKNKVDQNEARVNSV